MPIDEYYFSQRAVPKFGKMYFLKVPQEAGSTGGGESLLGSVVKEVTDWTTFLHVIPWRWYPVPRHMSTPAGVLKYMETNREKLALDSEPIVLEVKLAGAKEGITFKREATFGGGISKFPSIPAELGLDVDYSLLREAKLSFSAGTRMKYIPTGYFGRLHALVNGKHRQIDSSGVIGDNNIVSSILLAKDFTVVFKSDKTFNTEFKLKVEAANAGPSGEAKVTYKVTSNKTVEAKVKGKKLYLIALAVSDWDDFDLT